MTDEEIQELSDKYYIDGYDLRDHKSFEDIDYHEFNSFADTIQEYREKYDRVSITCFEGNGGYSYQQYPHFSMYGYKKMSREEIVEQIREAQQKELRDKQNKLDEERNAELQTIAKLREKYPEEFK